MKPSLGKRIVTVLRKVYSSRVVSPEETIRECLANGMDPADPRVNTAVNLLQQQTEEEKNMNVWEKNFRLVLLCSVFALSAILLASVRGCEYSSDVDKTAISHGYVKIKDTWVPLGKVSPQVK